MKKRNIEEEIQNLDVLVRTSEQIPSKLRNSIIKQVDVVRKCAKPRRSNKGRNQNQNSGLLKRVLISEEMARFANWDKNELHSRVDVTKVICVYIKNNKLQKPSNKKTILPDRLLTELLRWDEDMVVSMLSTSEDAHVFTISKKPGDGLKKLAFYKNSKLMSDGKEVAVIKMVEEIEDGKYTFIFEKDPEEVLRAGESYNVHVPLNYPKVQTKISIHLIKPEPSAEEAAKKEKSKKKEVDKPTSKPKSKKDKKPKKKEEPVSSSDEE